MSETDAAAEAAETQSPAPASWADTLRATLADPKEGPDREALVAAQAEVILQRVRVLVGISVFVMPTTILSFVAVSAPAQLTTAAMIVGAAVVAVLVHLFLVDRGVFDKHYHLAMLLLVGGVFGPTGAAIIEVTRNGEGSFLFAFFLIYFAFTALFPADVKWILATCLALVVSYVGVRLGRPEGIVFDSALTNDVLYLFELSFIGLVLNRVVVNLFFGERRAALQLARANAELKELDRAKTSFFSNVSHELRTPLTLILTPIKRMLQTPGLDPRVREPLRGVQGNANRLLKMVNQLLDFSRVEAGQAKVVPMKIGLEELLDYIATLFRPAAQERGITLDVRLPRSDAKAVQDLDKLEQILVNLLGNALKFTPSGGRVELACVVRADEFDLIVADTGPGIPKDQQRRIFDRFTQVEGSDRSSVRGTGIGLSMVREYARLLGGQVTLDSEEGKGSRFVVRLPRKVADQGVADTPEHRARVDEGDTVAADLWKEDAVAPSERVVECGDPSAPWILIVDDNPSLVQLIRSILEGRYNLYLAYDAEEGLQRLAWAGRVDLVISDVMMPGMSGLEFCQRIKQDPKTQLLPVILLTARGPGEGKIEGLRHGADDYIGKPFDPAELTARVEQLFEIRRITAEIERQSAAVAAAHERLKQEELKLIQSEKLRTMGDLAAGIFHELHNYLNMIHNGAVPLGELVEMVASEGAQPEDVDEARELSRLVVEAAEHALTVTRELKGYAHQDAAMHRVVSLHDVLRSNLRMFGKIPGSLEVVMDLSEQNLPVSCAPTHLVQVFTNLVKNAFEAMDNRGTVVLRSALDGNMAEVRVIDTGPGVSPDFHAKLFEPFQSTKRQGSGLGLGLSMARKVVEEHGGTLALDPEHTGGACFVVRLPVAQSRSAARA